MPNHDPKLFWAVFNFLCAALCGSLAWKSNLPDWLRIFLVIAALGFGAAAAVQLLDWLAHEYAVRTKEIQYAKVAHAVTVAHALRGLTDQQTEYVEKQAILIGVGIPGDPVIWAVEFPGGRVELDLIADFIAVSRKIGSGWLCPIRNHTNEAFHGYNDVETKLTRITNAFILQGWALKASGPYAAQLKPGVTWDYISEQFSVEA